MVGWRRGDGRFGVRDHLLVLPSVVCSTHAAREIATAEGAVAIAHQHGCLHVGDDLRHTESALIGTAVNPNVGGVLVVSLGCETIQGRRLARRIRERGQRVAFVGIQAAGGTERAVAEGREAVGELRAELAGGAPEPMAPEDLLVGIDTGDDELAPVLEAHLSERGWRTTTTSAASGAAAHVELAGLGAQAIVSLRSGGQAPTGFAICPVVAVARSGDLYMALHDDFDVDASDGEPGELARRVGDAVAAAVAGEPTAAERRGVEDFVLHRLAMTM
jgi:altronate dehydratase large subunit